MLPQESHALVKKDLTVEYLNKEEETYKSFVSSNITFTQLFFSLILNMFNEKQKYPGPSFGQIRVKIYKGRLTLLLESNL